MASKLAHRAMSWGFCHIVETFGLICLVCYMQFYTQPQALRVLSVLNHHTQGLCLNIIMAHGSPSVTDVPLYLS